MTEIEKSQNSRQQGLKYPNYCRGNTYIVSFSLLSARDFQLYHTMNILATVDDVPSKRVYVRVSI